MDATYLLNEPEQNYKSGYIKVYRSIKNHWLYESGRKRTKLEAWYDLLLQAKHSVLKETIGYDLIIINRGQILTSQDKLSRDWKWDRGAVRSFLNSLHLDQMLTIETTNKYTMITICNYDTYQDIQPAKKPTKQHQTNTTSTYTTNDKELKDIESKTYRQFLHLKISEEEVDVLKSKGYSLSSIDSVLDSIQNYKKNKNYSSLYLTALTWLKKDYPVDDRQQNPEPSEDDFKKIVELMGTNNRKPAVTR